MTDGRKPQPRVADTEHRSYLRSALETLGINAPAPQARFSGMPEAYVLNTVAHDGRLTGDIAVLLGDDRRLETVVVSLSKVSNGITVADVLEDVDIDLLARTTFLAVVHRSRDGEHWLHTLVPLATALAP